MLILTQKLPNIQEKIAAAPDMSYSIGVFIGTMLPFVVLCFFAYLMYSYAKGRNNNDFTDRKSVV